MIKKVNYFILLFYSNSKDLPITFGTFDSHTMKICISIKSNMHYFYIKNPLYEWGITWQSLDKKISYYIQERL